MVYTQYRHKLPITQWGWLSVPFNTQHQVMNFPFQDGSYQSVNKVLHPLKFELMMCAYGLDQ